MSFVCHGNAPAIYSDVGRGPVAIDGGTGILLIPLADK